MENEKILDINRSNDDNFNNLLNASNNALNSAIMPFLNFGKLSGIDEFMQFVKYDYSSLQITTAYNLLNLLSITYDSDVTQHHIAKCLSNAFACSSTAAYDTYGSAMERNRKRIKRIKDLYDKRNINHSSYLHSQPFTPRILSTDLLWYELLLEFPELKRFLFTDEATITKNFFNYLNSVYEKINSYDGYDRFYLMYKLEMSSKLELFYKILSSIKQAKRRLKLVTSDVENMINQMNCLHVVPYNPLKFALIASTSNDTELFFEILSTPYYKNTISCIVLNIDKLANYYTTSPLYTINLIKLLNFISNAVVFHLCTRIVNELPLFDKQKNLFLIQNIQHCKTSTVYFDNYINTHDIVNTSKNCSKDITFTHFKRVYKLKPDRKK